MTEPEDRTLEDRLAALLEAHPGMDAIRARRAEARLRPCAVPGSEHTGPTHLYPRGWRCEGHRPGQEILHAGEGGRGELGRSLAVSLPVPTLTYGTLTRDPLGRDGPGWEKSEQTRLPVWRGQGPERRRAKP